MRNATRFLWNTILLTATSLLMRLLAMSFQVYLTQRIGPEGIGLFELLMSVYGLAVSLSVSGVRLSTTRLVLEVTRRNGNGAVRLCLKMPELLLTQFRALYRAPSVGNISAMITAKSRTKER